MRRMKILEMVDTMKLMNFLIFSIAIALPSFSHAISGNSISHCNKNERFNDIRHLANFISHGSSDEDPRLPLDEFLKQNPDLDSNQIAATGNFVCASAGDSTHGMRGTAQVTGRRNLITTAAHLFYDEQCRRKDLSGCRFYFSDNPKSNQVYKINVNSTLIGPCTAHHGRDDWAVVELERDVPKNIIPYFVPSEPVTPKVGQQLVQIASHAADFQPSKGANGINCSVRDTTSFIYNPYLTDCSSGLGSSGAGQFSRKIMPGSSKVGLVLNAVVANGTGEDELMASPFNPDNNATSAAPVSGDFWEALHKRMVGHEQITSLESNSNSNTY